MTLFCTRQSNFLYGGIREREKACVQHYLRPCSLLLFLLGREKQATSFIISLLQCKPNPAYPESNFGSLLKTGPLAAEGLKPSVYLSEPLQRRSFVAGWRWGTSPRNLLIPSLRVPGSLAQLLNSSSFRSSAPEKREFRL